MDKQENEKQGTMTIVQFEAGILQTGTESSSAKENGVIITLNEKDNSGQHHSKAI